MIGPDYLIYSVGRVIIVDWAIPRDKFEETKKPNKHRAEKESTDDTSVKDEPLEDSDNEVEVKTEEREASSEDDCSSISSTNDTEDAKPFEKCDPATKIKPKPSHDIHEGKTVFLKNVPFSVTNGELKSFMETNVGPVCYAVICVDPLTEHSKGTAFVKFKVSGFLYGTFERISRSYQPVAFFLSIFPGRIFRKPLFTT